MGMSSTLILNIELGIARAREGLGDARFRAVFLVQPLPAAPSPYVCCRQRAGELLAISVQLLVLPARQQARRGTSALPRLRICVCRLGLGWCYSIGHGAGIQITPQF